MPGFQIFVWLLFGYYLVRLLHFSEVFPSPGYIFVVPLVIPPVAGNGW